MRSKGTKFFPGTITAIAPGTGGGSATCAILYDDGDREEGAVGANIRRVGPAVTAKASDPESAKDPKPATAATAGSSAPAEPRAKDANGLTLVAGDKVEARYKGKGASHFSCARTVGVLHARFPSSHSLYCCHPVPARHQVLPGRSGCSQRSRIWRRGHH